MPSARQATWFILPLALAVLFLGVTSLTGTPTPRGIATFIVATKFFCWVGFVLGASRFSWGDRMHVVWSLFAINMTILFAKDLCFSPALEGPGLELAEGTRRTVLGFGLTIANTCSTVATVLFARVWREAGLEVNPSKARQFAKLCVVPVAVVLFVIGMQHNVQKLPTDVWNTINLIVIPFADLVCVSLIGPLAVTAFSLRGGALSAPWAMFAIGAGFWLVWDVATSISHLSGATVEVTRVLALGYTGTAGIAQWWALRRK